MVRPERVVDLQYLVQSNIYGSVPTSLQQMIRH